MDAMAARHENAAGSEVTLPNVQREAFSRHDEQRLIEQLQAGNAEAFEVLFKRYAARVSRQAMHLLGNEAEAEEVTQEVFLTLYEKATTFRGDAALATWLYRLTANAALGRLRHRKRHPEVFMDDYLPRFRDDGHHLVRPVADWSHDLEGGVASEELRQLLHQAIEELPPLDRTVLVLSDFEELSNRDIGDVLGLSVSAVKARLHRARLFLRGKLAVSLGHAGTVV
jgi:RNA polymerase sigma-70 factor (ECF subfamily)